MSSTQMDLSPLVIDRKQDIASWPEGDIDQLAARDKNRYQKRKSAIIEYFQSDLPIEEIAARHRLSAVDSLETMARRCCAYHEDGRKWGFRALVPGARVRDAGESTLSSSELETESTRLLARDIDEATRVQEVSGDGVEKKGNTGEHQAVALTKIAQLPVTPVPVGVEEKIDLAVDKVQITVPDAEAEEAPSKLEVKQEEFPAITSVLVETVTEEEVKQEEFPALVSEVEIATDEAVEQEEFPTATSIVEEAVHVEVEEEEFPTTTSVIVETVADEEIEQAEFPASTSTLVEAVTDEEVEQKEFLTATSGVVEAVPEEEVEQKEFLTATSGVVEAVPEEEVEQKEFPVIASAVETSEELELAEDDDELEGEPTGKLSVVKPGIQNTRSAPIAEEATEVLDPELVPTAQLVTAPDEEQEELSSEEASGEKVDEVDAADTVAEEAEVAELDTVEVARVVVEERRNRVAAVETIKVPAAMLEALEKADRALQTRPEEADDDASTEATGAGTADQTLIALPDLPEPALPQSIPDDGLEKGDVAAIPTQTLEAWRRDTRQLTQTPTLKSPTQSQAEDSRYRITGSQAAIKHAVRRRWGKQGRQQKYRRWVRIISAAVIVSILVILLIPLGAGLVGYNAYTNIKSVANDGVSNLLALKDLMPANKNDLLSALSPQKLATAKTELQKAQSDFLQLQDMVNRPDIESLLQQFAPQYSGELDMARHLVQVALDVSRMGQELIGVGQMVAPVLHSSGSLLSSSSTTPLFSADEVNAVEAALLHAQYYIGDIQTQMSQVNLAKLPIGSATQKTELAKYLNQIPQAQSAITQAQTLVGPVAWLLGVGQARHFLVQTLDRAELRPSGGFEGQYGILTLQNGRMSPFTLKDITQLDYAENGAELNRLPPSQYSWMNFGMWGVRDANLSADYPTNAQLVMRVFQEEGGGPIDGDIQFTPVLISQLLQLTGPLYVKEYKETVTAQNLEDKLHYYQQDFSAINVERDKTGTSNASTRKAFTALVGKLLLDRVHSLKISQLMDFSKVLLQDLKTRDLQIYFTNPEAEQWLVQNGYSGAMPQFTNGNDGFMVVQANISISKATQYVHSTFNDQVTLDAQGGATHNLTITLDYNNQNNHPIYGFDTYTDYVRVYAPANAQFQGGSGFVDTSHTLCTPGTTKTKKGTGTGGTGGTGGTTGTTGTGSSGTPTGCSQYNSYYPGGERYCSSGNYSLGTGYVASKGFVPWPVYAPSGPTEMQSDLSGYKMWGGLTQTPKNCTSTISLSWYVPHAVQNTPGKAPYQMIVGHQAGWPDTAEISIDASALKGHVKSLNYNKTINVDTLVALAPLPLPPSQSKPGSTPTPAVTPTATTKKP